MQQRPTLELNNQVCPNWTKMYLRTSPKQTLTTAEIIRLPRLCLALYGNCHTRFVVVGIPRLVVQNEDPVKHHGDARWPVTKEQWRNTVHVRVFNHLHQFVTAT